MKFSTNHVWLDENRFTVGISHFAQESLGDIVFIQLPQIGESFQQGEEFGSVESVKSVSALYAPVTMKIIETNVQLEDSPEIINSSPYGNGWIVKVEILNKEELAHLLSEEEYLQRITAKEGNQV